MSGLDGAHGLHAVAAKIVRGGAEFLIGFVQLGERGANVRVPLLGRGRRVGRARCSDHTHHHQRNPRGKAQKLLFHEFSSGVEYTNLEALFIVIYSKRPIAARPLNCYAGSKEEVDAMVVAAGLAVLVLICLLLSMVQKPPEIGR
jgi:hypothetical protein